MDVRLPSGVIVKGIPEGTSKEAIKQKLISSGVATEADFGALAPPTPEIGAAFEGINGFQEAYDPRTAQPLPEDVPFVGVEAPAPPPVPQLTLGQQAVGAAETALSAITGATGGSVGMIGGTIEGLYKAYKAGKLGTQEGADIVEQEAMRQAEKFTYEPRTETGREFTQELGEALAPMQALGPVSPIRRPGKPPRMGETPKLSGKPATISGEELARQTKKAAEGGLGSARAKETVAIEAAPDPETLASAERLGVSEYLQPDHITSKQQFREISQLIKSRVGSPARAEELRGLEQVARKADEVISEAGGTDDWSTLRTDVKMKMENTQKQLSDQAEKYYGQVREAIDPKTRVQPSNILSYLDTQADELGGKQNLSLMEKNILKRMRPKEGQPSYALLDRTRKDLTAARVKKQGVFKDEDTGKIKQLEQQLLADQKNVADQFGVSEIFDDARRSVAIRKSLEDDMASLFGKQLDGSFITPLRTGVKKLAEGDMSRFEKTINAIPKEMRSQVVASAMESAFGKSGRRGDISFSNYATWYENAKKNKQAFDAVMQHLPSQSRKKFFDLYKVSDGIRKSSKEYIATGRGESLRQSLEGVDGMFRKLIGMAAPGALEAVIPGMGTVMAIKRGLEPKKSKGMDAVDDLLISPQFNRMMRERVKTGNSKPETVRRVAGSPQFKRYLKAVGAEARIIREPDLWIIEAMRPPTEEPLVAENQE